MVNSPKKMTLLAVGESPMAPAPRVASIVAIEGRGQARITFDDGGAALTARSTVRLHPADAGRQALVLFESNDPLRPIITGLLQGDRNAPSRERRRSADVTVDGERIVIEATRELELRCGEGSIVLTSEGTVVIKGVHVVSRAKGANKVRGATVLVN